MHEAARMNPVEAFTGNEVRSYCSLQCQLLVVELLLSLVTHLGWYYI